MEDEKLITSDNKLTLNAKEHIDYVIQNFDFKKVHKVMTFLDWKWALIPTFGVPDIREMKKVARKLLVAMAKDGVEFGCWTGTGGFKAIRGYDSLELSFEVDTWTTEGLNYGAKYEAAKLLKDRQLKMKKIIKSN